MRSPYEAHTQEKAPQETQKETEVLMAKKQGRPSKYNELLCDEILAYFDVAPYDELDRVTERKNGDIVTEKVRVPAELPTLAGFAKMIGVHRDTLHEWTKVHPTFSDALKRAKECQEHILITNSLMGLYSSSPSIFAAKNLIGWRDQVDHQLTGQDGGPLKFTVNYVGTDSGTPGKT